MLTTVILNIDGTITDLSHFHYISWKSLFTQNNFKFNKKIWETVKYKTREDVARTVMGFNKHNNDLNLLNKICNDKKNLFKKIVKKYLTSDSVFYATSKLINEIKKMNLKLICGSISANAKTELDLLKLTNKFDFIYSPQCKKRGNLSINEKTKISPIKAILNDLSLSSEECIGIDNTYGRIAEFNNLNIFSVGICSSNKNIEKIAKFSFDNPEDLDLKKILFAYYKTNGKLIS